MNFNNNMKQVLHILLTLLLLFTFSCNDDNVNNDNNSILIGSWGEQFPADEFFELTFYNDDNTKQYDSKSGGNLVYHRFLFINQLIIHF